MATPKGGMEERESEEMLMLDLEFLDSVGVVVPSVSEEGEAFGPLMRTVAILVIVGWSGWVWMSDEPYTW